MLRYALSERLSVLANSMSLLLRSAVTRRGIVWSNIFYARRRTRHESVCLAFWFVPFSIFTSWTVLQLILECKHFFSSSFSSLSTLKNERHCYTLRHCDNACLGDCFKAKKNHCHCWQWLLLIALWRVYFAVSLSWIATTSRPTSRAFWRAVSLPSISMKRTLWLAASPSCER